MQEKVILETKNVVQSFPVADGEFVALKNINIKVYNNSLTILRGRSGSGKTTLMNILGALDSPKSGSVIMTGKDIVALSEHEREDIRRKKIGFVFQSVALIPMMTAYENVEFALRLAGCRENRAKRTKEVLNLVGLGRRMNHMPQELSGGEQQRVAIARALAKNPKLLLCDEPTGALDYNTGKAILRLLQNTSRQTGMTVVIITHNLALTPMADRVIRVKNGTVYSVEKNENPVSVDLIEW